MGDWSDYFEDFPEENPGNYVNGVFNPQLAKQIRARESNQAAALSKATAEVNALIAKSKRETKAKSLLHTEFCPQCGVKALNVYGISDRFFLCEYQECGIYGKGTTYEMALKKTTDAIGEYKDWRDEPQF